VVYSCFKRDESFASFQSLAVAASVFVVVVCTYVCRKLMYNVKSTFTVVSAIFKH